MIDLVHAWTIGGAVLAAIAGSALGAASGAMARRWVGGWTVPCRPRERDVYERRIAEYEQRIAEYEHPWEEGDTQ